MLTTRWHSALSLAITTLLIILVMHISPVVAQAKFPLIKPVNSTSWGKNITNIADNPLITTKQHPSSLLQQLNLTSQQKEQIKRVHHQYKQQIRKKKHSLDLLQKQLSDLLVGTESVELIRAKNEQLVNLRQEIGELRFESMLATREILTPQQRQKFREIIESQLAQ